jgi:hypothetical protein
LEGSDLMSWMEHRSDIEIEIAECANQIETLQRRMEQLLAKKKEQEKQEELILKLKETVGRR